MSRRRSNALQANSLYRRSHRRIDQSCPPYHLRSQSGSTLAGSASLSYASRCLAGREAGETAVCRRHYARTRADMIYADELEALAQRHDGLRVETVFTADGGDRISEASLTRLVPDLATRETWLCGPAGFMDVADALVTAASDLPLHREQFAATRREAAHGEGSVRFLKSDIAASGESGSLLEVAEGAGLKPNYGCRMGICHACKCRVAEGSVRDLRTNRVRDVRDSDIQLCIHAAAGDV